MGRDITKCHPRLQEAFQQLLAKCSAQGLAVGLGECFRTVAEQDALYAQGADEAGEYCDQCKGIPATLPSTSGELPLTFTGTTEKGAYNESDSIF